MSPPARWPAALALSLTVALTTAHAAPIVQSLQLMGVHKAKVSEMRLEQVMQLTYALIHARNLVAGLPEDTTDPLPCQNGSLLYGEVKGGQEAYAIAKASLLAQGWKMQKEVPGHGETALQFQKGAVTALGLWVNVLAQKEAALIMCEQATEWKPAPPAQAPTTSPKLGNALTLQASSWKGGERGVRPILTPAGVGVGSGKISANGHISLNLQTPRAERLQPVTAWKTLFPDLMECSDSKGFRGKVTLSDPTVKLATVNKLVPTPQLNENEYLSSTLTNQAVTRIVATPLIYASAPVKLSGQLTCSDGERNLKVAVNLPAGWSAVTLLIDLPDFGTPSQTLSNFDGRWTW